ncbi:hypothetical protein EP56_01770 [Listeriaceae bacterium FSL A5-0209]|nr:hypothetical protein EP56_01770 [Listeriaceae bacterium FSL A5-0209]
MKKSVLWGILGLLVLTIGIALASYFLGGNQEAGNEDKQIEQGMSGKEKKASDGDDQYEAHHTEAVLKKQVETFVQAYYNADYAKSNGIAWEDYMTASFYASYQRQMAKEEDYQDDETSITLRDVSFYVSLDTPIRESSEVRVLVPFQTTIKSAYSPDRNQQNWIEITLLSQGDTWLVNRIENKNKE